ncbi:uncharacterized histidine-rich protein DDB_G0274557-like [Lolium rigidum]|uniref:uncharacterized histidine-rich protein DDB_G0274557-like n=1 Tax=Lolium rigidum TaxID=89674 RepID=UPI001F5D9E44|nr:uncharacterized histidine-rich protein DDB_G0274557-like [Lolium rigidum]
MTHGHGHHGGHHDHGGHHQPLPHHHEQHHQPHGHHHHPHGHSVPVIPIHPLPHHHDHHHPPHHHPHGHPVPVIPMPVTYSYLPTTVGTPLLEHRRPPSSALVGLLTCIFCFVLVVVLLVLWF